MEERRTRVLEFWDTPQMDGSSTTRCPAPGSGCVNTFALFLTEVNSVRVQTELSVIT